MNRDLAKQINDMANENLIRIKNSFTPHLKLVNKEEIIDLKTSSAENAIHANRDVVKRYKTGIEGIDKLFTTHINNQQYNGLAEKDIILLSGMSGIGKTSLSLSIFCNLYKSYVKTTFFSFDMKELQTWDAIKIALCGFEGDDHNYLDIIQTVGYKPQVVCCRENITISRLDKYLTTNPQEVIFIDYFDKLITEENNNTEKKEYKSIMKQLKQLVDKHKCCLVLLIQGNEDKGHKSGRPTLMNVYGGKEIRSEVDHVLAVYRRSKHDDQMYESNRLITEVIGLKLRSHAVNDTAYLKMKKGQIFDASMNERISYINDINRNKKGK